MPGILARASTHAGSRALHPPAGWAEGFLLTCLLLYRMVASFALGLFIVELGFLCHILLFFLLNALVFISCCRNQILNA